MKPGWQTSEMWLTLLHQLLSVGMTLGVWSAADARTLEGILSVAVVAVFSLIASAVSLRTYTQSRAEVKAASARLASYSEVLGKGT